MLPSVGSLLGALLRGMIFILLDISSLLRVVLLLFLALCLEVERDDFLFASTGGRTTPTAPVTFDFVVTCVFMTDPELLLVALPSLAFFLSVSSLLFETERFLLAFLLRIDCCFFLLAFCEPMAGSGLLCIILLTLCLLS